jgi:hypothetical protein
VPGGKGGLLEAHHAARQGRVAVMHLKREAGPVSMLVNAAQACTRVNGMPSLGLCCVTSFDQPPFPSCLPRTCCPTVCSHQAPSGSATCSLAMVCLTRVRSRWLHCMAPEGGGVCFAQRMLKIPPNCCLSLHVCRAQPNEGATDG